MYCSLKNTIEYQSPFEWNEHCTLQTRNTQLRQSYIRAMYLNISTQPAVNHNRNYILFRFYLFLFSYYFLVFVFVFFLVRGVGWCAALTVLLLTLLITLYEVRHQYRKISNKDLCHVLSYIMIVYPSLVWCDTKQLTTSRGMANGMVIF